MKKLKMIFLAFAMALSAVFCGCVGTYTPAADDDGNKGKPGTEKPDNGNNGGDTTTPFTVRLECDGKEVIPIEGIGAQWYNGEQLYTAYFVDGEASVTGLDGDYRVTLTEMPAGYTYNPNGSDNLATNRNRNITLELLPVLTPTGKGTGFLGNAYSMTQAGTYGLKFTEAGQTAYCKFTPPERGSYILESLMDITANEVNPRLEDYGQNPQYVPTLSYETCKDGGFSSAYTRNFKYTVDIDSDCFNFTVRCDSRVGYPVTVYFTITYADDYSREPVYEFKIPEFIYRENDGSLPEGSEINPTYYFIKGSPAPTGTYVKCGREAGNNQGMLDAKKFALGEDGYYHLKDEDGNPTLSILYADLDAFTGGRYHTNEETGESYYVPTSVKVGDYDYLYFIKGWAGIMERYTKEEFVPDKYMYLKDGKGYLDTRFTESNQRVAVTAELQEFLQAYAASSHLFFDGMGPAEHDGYNSADDDQWLYYCCYYI